MIYHIQNINKIIFIFIIFLFQNQIIAQAPDSNLCKTMQIKSKVSYIRIYLLPRKNSDDSAIYERVKYDKNGRIIEELKNFSTLGYGYNSLNQYELNHFGMPILQHTNNGDGTITYKYVYDQNQNVIKLLNLNVKSNDSILFTKSYTYLKNGKIYSCKTTTYTPNDTFIEKQNYKYNDYDHLETLTTYDNDNQLVSRQTYDISEKGLLLEYRQEIRLPKPSTTIMWNYFDPFKRIIKTQYSNNTYTEYFYDFNGLLIREVSYNVDGRMDRSISHVYEFDKP